MALWLLRYQPFKAVYLTYFVVTLLLFRLPYYFLISIIPWLRPAPSWPIRRAILVRALQVIVPAVFDTASWKYLRADPHAFAKKAEEVGLVWIDAQPDLIVGEIKELAQRNRVTVEQVAGYWYGARDPDTKRAGQRAGPDEKVMLAFHAGGFVIGDASPTGASAEMYRRLLRELPQFNRLFAVEYRLSQGPPLPIENPVPAAIIDAVIAYNYLVNELGFKPHNILVLGDSAGGTVTTQLAKYIATCGLPSLPVPGGLLLLSPSLDWGETHTHSESSMKSNYATDWVEAFNLGYCSRAMLGYLPFSEAQSNWWFSPAGLALPETKGTFKNFPPTIFLVGEAEMTIDCMKTARDRMRQDIGVENVAWAEIPDATHILLALPYHEEEIREAYRAVRNWANKVF